MSAASTVGRAGMATRWVASVLAFQGAWLACVLSAADGHPALGLFAVGAAVGLMLMASRDRQVDLRLIAVAMATGTVADTLLVQLDLVRYASAWPMSDGAPAWILALWALWGAVLREPLRWLHGRPAVAALLGALGGPLSYVAAARLGACTFPDAVITMTVLAVFWAAVTPLHLGLAARWLRRSGASR